MAREGTVCLRKWREGVFEEVGEGGWGARGPGGGSLGGGGG